MTRAELLEVFPRVAQAIADALGRDLGDVKLESRLMEDLGAESIDYLDIVFRLEKAFHVKIPRGQIVENARGDLPEEDFAQKGIVTGAGLKRLKDYLSEIPGERFQEPLKVADIPALFTAETFAKTVARALRVEERSDR